MKANAVFLAFITFALTTCNPISPNPDLATITEFPPSQTPTITLENILPISTVSSEVILPSLFYILDNKLFEQVGDPPGREIARLPGTDRINAVFRTGNILLVMRQEGIHRLELSDGTSEMIFKFDRPATTGGFFSFGDGTRVFYLAGSDDAQAEAGTASQVGLYDLNLETITPVITYTKNMGFLGTTVDNLSLYFYYLDLDTTLGSIFLVDIQKGEIIQELAFQGDWHTSLARDGRHLVTLNPYYDPVENTLDIYDLTSSPGSPPRIFKLPNAPSQIFGTFIWSPDSRIIYFLLMSGHYTDDIAVVKPYGVWHLDIGSGEMSLLSNMNEVPFFLERISKDGEWLFLRCGNKAIWVNAYTGAQKAFELPENIMLVDD